MKRWPLVLIITAYLFAPPLLHLGYTIWQATTTYTGTCPGLMDIEPYACTLGEYIGRHTTSPFAAIGHMFIWGSWLTFAFFTLTLAAAGYYVWKRKNPSTM